jgi:hypothetical protein
MLEPLGTLEMLRREELESICRMLLEWLEKVLRLTFISKLERLRIED